MNKIARESKIMTFGDLKMQKTLSKVKINNIIYIYYNLK